MTLAVAASLLLLAGCGAMKPTAQPTETVTVTVTAQPETQHSVQPETQPPASSPSTQEMLKFGETYRGTRADVTVSAPRPHTPTNPMGTEIVTAYLVMDVTILNRGDEAMNTDLMSYLGDSGGKHAEGFYDSANNISEPHAELLPGQTITYQVGFGVADPADFTMSCAYGSFARIYWSNVPR